MQKYIDQLKNLGLKIKQKPYISISILLVAVLVIITALAVPISQTSPYGTLKVETKVKGSQFIFNNQVYYAPVVIPTIAPGTYSVTAHNNGYQDESYPVTISAGQIVTVSLKMKAVPDKGEDENEQAMSYGSQANQQIEARSMKYPLTNYLPQAFGVVMLDYHVASNGAVEYVVYSIQAESYNKSDYKQQINNFIQSKGINPTTVSIQWE